MSDFEATTLELLRAKLQVMVHDGERLTEFVGALEDHELEALLFDWELWARPNQLPPDSHWVIWMVMAGRGFGKTRVGAELTRKWAEEKPIRIALVAEDAGDARDVMVEGESGILAVSPPWFKPIYEPSKRRLTWPNGSRATIYSDKDPESLRGPQHHKAWVDELAKYKNGKVLWSNLMFGLRLGYTPQVVVTTTPRPVPLVRQLTEHEFCVVTRGTTYENMSNLAPVFIDEVVKEYEGTTLGRQELEGELLDPEEAGVIRRSWLRKWPAKKPIPKLMYVVQSYDTAFTEKTFDPDKMEPDYTACTVWGVFDAPKGHSVLLLDAWREQMGYPALRRKMKSEYKDVVYGPEDQERQADLVLIEEKGSGISILQDMRVYGIPARGYNPGRADKLQRLHAGSHLIEHGLVYIPESSKRKGEFVDWSETFVNEVCSQPMADAWDFTDTLSQVILVLRDMQLLKIRVSGDEEEFTEEPRRKVNPYSQ